MRNRSPDFLYTCISYIVLQLKIFKTRQNGLEMALEANRKDKAQTRGEKQQGQKPIIVIGPDEGNTAKTRGKDWRWLLMLNLPLLQVFLDLHVGVVIITKLLSLKGAKVSHYQPIKEIKDLGVFNLECNIESNTIRKKAKSSLRAHTQPNSPWLPANPGLSFRCGKTMHS